MSFKNLSTVSQGSVGLGVAVAYFVKNGYIVSLPLNDNQAYDLIVDNGTLKKVSVKTTGFKERNNTVFTVQLKSVRHNKSRNKVVKFDSTLVDILFVYTESGDIFLIPSDLVHGKNSLSLGKKVEAYKVK